MKSKGYENSSIGQRIGNARRNCGSCNGSPVGDPNRGPRRFRAVGDEHNASCEGAEHARINRRDAARFCYDRSAGRDGRRSTRIRMRRTHRIIQAVDKRRYLRRCGRICCRCAKPRSFAGGGI